MASKEEFYEGINEDTFAGAEFCRKLYGYCLYDDTFLERVMEKFKTLGRDKFIYVYSTFVQIYTHFQIEEEKEAGRWLVGKTEKEYERKVKEAEWEKKQQERGSLRKMSDQELIMLLKNLTDAT